MKDLRSLPGTEVRFDGANWIVKQVNVEQTIEEPAIVEMELHCLDNGAEAEVRGSLSGLHAAGGALNWLHRQRYDSITTKRKGGESFIDALRRSVDNGFSDHWSGGGLDFTKFKHVSESMAEYMEAFGKAAGLTASELNRMFGDAPQHRYSPVTVEYYGGLHIVYLDSGLFPQYMEVDRNDEIWLMVDYIIGEDMIPLTVVDCDTVLAWRRVAPDGEEVIDETWYSMNGFPIPEEYR